MAAKRSGLGLVLSPEGPPGDDEDFDEDEYSGDLGLDELGGELDPGAAMPGADEELGAGAFESYADTMFNPEATPEERSSALRQAIETIIEEKGGGGGGF